MARIPTVTPKDLHTVQLSPQLRKILHHRAAAANRREAAPILRADRRAYGEADREYGLQASSVRNSSQMIEGALTTALKGLKGSGLSGGYLRQTQHELRSRQGDALQAIPALLSGAAEERAKSYREAGTKLAEDRAAMLAGTAQDFNSLLASARSSGSQKLKEDAEHKASAEKEHREDERSRQAEHSFDPGNLQDAKLALKDALAEWKKNPTITVKLPDGSTEEKKLQEVNPLESPEDWLKFAHGLEKGYGGFGLAEINHVIQQYMTVKQHEEHRGKLPQPGVPGQG